MRDSPLAPSWFPCLLTRELESVNRNVGKHPRLLAPLFATVISCLSPMASHAADDPVIRLPNGKQYHPSNSAELPRLIDDVRALCQTEEEFLVARKAERKQQRGRTPQAEMSADELKSYYAEPPDKPTNGELRGLQEIQRLAG